VPINVKCAQAKLTLDIFRTGCREGSAQGLVRFYTLMPRGVGCGVRDGDKWEEGWGRVEVLGPVETGYENGLDVVTIILVAGKCDLNGGCRE
jgi:hypothetical protein